MGLQNCVAFPQFLLHHSVGIPLTKKLPVTKQEGWTRAPSGLSSIRTVMTLHCGLLLIGLSPQITH